MSPWGISFVAFCSIIALTHCLYDLLVIFIQETLVKIIAVSSELVYLLFADLKIGYLFARAWLCGCSFMRDMCVYLCLCVPDVIMCTLTKKRSLCMFAFERVCAFERFLYTVPIQALKRLSVCI